MKFRGESSFDKKGSIAETVRLAHLASSRSKWVEARALWGMCFSLDPQDQFLVSYLESSRLAGTLEIEGFPKSLSLAKIIHILTPEFSSNLVAEYVRLTPWSESNLKAIKRAGLLTHPAIVRAIAIARLRKGTTSKDLGVKKVHSIWDSSQEQSNFRDGYRAFVPPLQIVNDIAISQPEMNLDIRSATVLTVSDVRAVIGSDFIESKGVLFGDLVSWPGIDGVNFVNDSWALAANSEKVALIRDITLSGPTARFDKACWLGYPMSSSWGHWVPDFLTRLVYFHEMNLLPEAPVLVPSDTPQHFLDFGELLFPEVQWVKLPTSTVLEAEKLYVSPARTFSIPNMYWTLDGINKRCITEPQNFEMLRVLALAALDREGANLNDREYGEKIFLDRSLSLYRRSRNAEKLREVATSRGYEVMDPGLLTPLEQLKMFSQAKFLAGADGSQWLWSILAAKEAATTIIGHDYSTDSRGRAWSIGSVLETTPSWILGLRDFPGPGYSEPFYHQDFTLLNSDFEVIEHQLGINS